MDLKESGSRVRTGLIWLSEEPVTDFCENVNEPFGLHRGRRNFLTS
jgi:hypothetical protein